MNNFQILVNQLPSDQRSIQGKSGKWNMPLNHCFLGVPQSDFFGWNLLESIPKKCLGFHFYLGGTPVELMTEFAKSKYPSQIEKLIIGDSSFANGSGLDYSEIIKTIQFSEFPELTELRLGIWELFCNSHCLFGKIGNITTLLNNCPKLEKLGLYGQFELLNTHNFSKLKKLSIELEDYTTGFNGGFISNGSLSNILDSKFPSLEEVFIDLICEEDDYGYMFTENFLSGNNYPSLKKMEITGGFAEGEKERLLSSALYKKKNVIFHFDDMVVS